MNIPVTKDLLYEMYIDKHMSMSSIGSFYSVSAPTVRNWLIYYKIPTRISTRNIYQELKETEFTDYQKAIIIGSTLGDGSLTMGKDAKNARFVVRHGERQKDYLFWKNKVLKPFTTSKVQKSDKKSHCICNTECNVSDSYMFTTISHPWLTHVRRIFYPSGIKIIPNSIYDLLSNISMAIWVCDDGSLTYNKKFGIYRMDLHTECFTYKDNVFLCRNLSEKYDMGFRINSRKYLSGKSYYICISGKDNLCRLVSNFYEFVPSCMRYKFKYYV